MNKKEDKIKKPETINKEAKKLYSPFYETMILDIFGTSILSMVLIFSILFLILSFLFDNPFWPGIISSTVGLILSVGYYILAKKKATKKYKKRYSK